MLHVQPYEQSPQIVLVYPKYLQAYNSARWTGWTPMFNGRGPAFVTTATVDSYVNLKPVSATASSGGGARGATIAIAAAVVIAAAVAIMHVRRRRVRPGEA